MKPANPAYICANCIRATRQQSSRIASRNFSAQPSRLAFEGSPNGESSDQVPRWQRTPPAMRMPLRLRPKPRGPIWVVNDQQEPVDEAYDRFLGRVGGNTRGRDMLDEETKWLALTHKSHAHGAQGFNDRLAFLGRRILELQTSLALLRAPVPISLDLPREEVYHHESLQGLENVTAFTKHHTLLPERLASLAQSYGIDKVVRWKPKKAENMRSSGQNTVLAHTIFSIIGALALKKGGEVAARTARERVLQPLGLR